MADNELDEEQQKKAAAAAPPVKGGWFEEHAFGSAMQFIRQVDHLLVQYEGNVPEEEKKVLQAAWRRLGPLDQAMVQNKLGSKLNAAKN